MNYSHCDHVHSHSMDHSSTNNITEQGNSVFNFIQGRKQTELPLPSQLINPYVARKLPEILKPTEYDMGTIDKIFASHWLDTRNVVYGTKCNKVCTTTT